MEIANASFDSMRRFVTGFRIPDLSRMWSGHDEVDYQVPSVPLIIKLEYYLVRCQELALWTDPKASLMALACIHLAFGYLATTVNTTLNLALWAVLSGKSFAFAWRHSQPCIEGELLIMIHQALYTLLGLNGFGRKFGFQTKTDKKIRPSLLGLRSPQTFTVLQS